MRHVTLGRTGLPVSRLCLGTMTFGLQCDEDTSRAIMDKAFDAGIDFFDTADVYPLGGDRSTVGRTEEIVGRWLKGRRDDVIVATKCFGATGPRRWDSGMSRKHILDAIDGSLRRLGTDYIDLYQLHGDDPRTPLDETLSALDTLVRNGKVRYIGCSNWPAWRLARAIGRSEVLGTARFDSVQPRYNLLFRPFERDLFPLCQAEGIGCIPYNPLAGGLLSGKHRRGAPPAEGRFALGTAAERYQERYWHEAEFDAVDELRALADGVDLSLVHVALGWVLSKPWITAPIIGASSPSQLDAALEAVEHPLDTDLVKRLDELTAGWRRSDADR